MPNCPGMGALRAIFCICKIFFSSFVQKTTSGNTAQPDLFVSPLLPQGGFLLSTMRNQDVLTLSYEAAT